MRSYATVTDSLSGEGLSTIHRRRSSNYHRYHQGLK